MTVSDSGIGIAADEMTRLFREFEQLDGGVSKRHGGTGLGLALTKKLVEAQGGSVGATSTVGEGSTFFAILPRRATTGSPLPAPREFSGSRPEAPSILVIEDNPRDQETIVGILREAGYAVQTAATGAQALAVCEARSFDAITLDLLLPDGNGLEVLRSIRGTHPNRDVPVIVITVVTEAGVVAGFAVHDILGKPLDGDVLLQSLRRAGAAPGAPGAVLVVDDDTGSLELMRASLRQLGYQTTCVDRAMEGLTIASAEAPIAVVLDIMMPEMNGFEFLAAFREIPACRHVPVVVWTAKDLSDLEYSELLESAHTVLQKGRSAGTAVIDELKPFLSSLADAPPNES